MWGIFGEGDAESSTGKLQWYWTVQIVKKVSSCEINMNKHQARITFFFIDGLNAPFPFKTVNT